MADNKKFEPLYKKNNSNVFVCTKTGKKCERVTQHFEEFNRYLKRTRCNYRPVYTTTRNLCAETNCPVWTEMIQQIAKNNQR